MPNKITSIAKNTSYFTFALVIQKIFSFIFFTIMARNLVPEDLGKFYFAISFTTIFSVFIDLGLANVLIREIAKTKERAKELLGTVLAIKIVLAVITTIVLLLLINLMGYSELTRQLVYLSSLTMLLDSFTLIFFSVVRGHHNLKYESVASIIFQVIILVFGVAVIKLNLGLQYLMLVFVSASVFNFIYSFILVRFKWKINVKPIFNYSLIKPLIAIAIPFGIFGILQRLYMYFDTVLLSALSGDHYVGLYQISFKVIFALQFLPMAFIASLYPAFASYWKDYRIVKDGMNNVGDSDINEASAGRPANESYWKDYRIVKDGMNNVGDSDINEASAGRPANESYWKDYRIVKDGMNNVGDSDINEASAGRTANESYWKDSQSLSNNVKNASTDEAHQLVVTFERAMNYLIIISLPISIGIIVLADKIMSLFKPEYIDAILPLQIIMASLIFVFINFPIGALLNACDRQKINTINMSITLFSSIALNFILIPFFQSSYDNGAIGASITVILTNILMFLLGIIRIPAIISVRPMKIISTFLKVLVSVSLMGIIIYFTKENINIFLVVPTGALVYFASLLLLGGFRKEDILSIYKSFLTRNT